MLDAVLPDGFECEVVRVMQQSKMTAIIKHALQQLEVSSKLADTVI